MAGLNLGWYCFQSQQFYEGSKQFPEQGSSKMNTRSFFPSGKHGWIVR